MGPLQGIKVLDLSRILAGPWATQVLADFGAQVWKVERPNAGDDTRKWGPPFLQDEQGNDTSEAAYYLAANRGKHSVTIDITSTEGQKLIHQLAAKADIVVENFKVGGLKKYGLDYESMKAVNPSIIYCSITGFGQTGPDSKRAGYDAMIQAMGGLMSLTGVPEGQPGAGPQKVGVAVVDIMTGMYAVSGILAALHHRNTTGIGQYIDLALLDTQVSWLANQGMNYLVGEKVPKPQGTAHPNIVPYQAFATKDGHIMLAVGNDSQFQRCVQALGVPELAEDERFITNQLRVANRELLLPLVSAAFAQQNLDYWLDALNQAGVPCGPINTLDRVYAEPQVQHREMVMELNHANAPKVKQVANPIKFSQTKVEYKKAPPILGEDTNNILTSQLGLSPEQLRELEKQKII
ncbi:CaiB/BaiF CoA transferase family protein [Thalassomonas sp. M1454]|uniref:CaiB/BaiF CoA transferase family protein n=1 Tax=Thalassomonas sp. M1454 TaxID=2594477 RepID=UPI001180C002|nr:CaiB/BaiF CoA-transferase family protein [Thalassomonas sp. M1454]TRX55060.1 CoA transferase [Thalassomonas sp. M1454]